MPTAKLKTAGVVQKALGRHQAEDDQTHPLAERAIRYLRERALESLTQTRTTDDPQHQWNLAERDRMLRIDAGTPLHDAVVELLTALPSTETYVDRAGNRNFRDDETWSLLVDASRSPVANEQEYRQKRNELARLRSQFSKFISERFEQPETSPKYTFVFKKDLRGKLGNISETELINRLREGEIEVHPDDKQTRKKQIRVSIDWLRNHT